jgi:hypothetical protein
VGNELVTFSTGFMMLGGGVDVDVRRSVDVDVRRGMDVDVRRGVDVGGAIEVSGGVEDTGRGATCDNVRSTSPVVSTTNPLGAGKAAACRFL